MGAKRVYIIAEKEFSDTITGGRFLLVLAMFLIIAAVGASQGIQDYNTALDRYKDITEHGQDENYSTYWQISPTVMDIFMKIGESMTILGAILGIAVGFDLISGEREGQTLKLLLSNPVYRDEVITGKMLGGVMTLAFTMATVLGVSLAILLIAGLTPTPGEMGLILIFGVVSLLYLTGCFAIALAMSGIAKRSGTALMYSLVIFFFLSAIIPAVGTLSADTLAGEKPLEPALVSYDTMEEEWTSYQDELRNYEINRKVVIDTFNIFSPQINYERISRAITQPLKCLIFYGGHYDNPCYYSVDEDIDYSEIFSILWKNIIALILIPVFFMGLAYVTFLRIDLR